MDLCLIAQTAEANPWIDWGYLGAIGMVALGLGFVIFVHELGHFLAAKACGVKAEKFYVGFDIPMPKIFGWQIPSTFAKYKWGETEYGIGILPLGGYVKMLGQDDDPRKYKEETARAKNEPQESGVATAMTPVEPIPDKPAFDPRSYQAKSVPQRMLIISAGVIMNLIFAVIMGAAAYSMGVPYTPTVIGQAPAGSPGWTKDLRPGDHIIRIGEGEAVSDTLRFEQDLLPKILLSNGREVELLIDREGKENVVTVSGRKLPDRKLYLLGIASSPSTTVHASPNPAKFAGSPQPEDLPQAGDKIVAVDGKPLPTDETAYAHFQQILASQPGETLTLTVERPIESASKDKSTQETKILDVKLPPQPLLSFGLVMDLGPVSAVREGSPAQRSGILPGDQIVSINNEPLGDPLTLSQRLLKLVGEKNVPIEIQRAARDKKTTETLTRNIDPEPPVWMETGVDSIGGDQVGLEPLGIAAPVGFKVLEVREPAAKAGLQSGDEVIGVQFIIPDTKEAEKLTSEATKQITLAPDKINWVTVNALLQELPVGTKADLTYRRDGKVQTVTLTPVALEDAFFEPRGLTLGPLKRTRTAENMAEAWYLGFRETKDKLREVGNVLRGLVTGDIPLGNLGGPITIARVAHSEASQGWGRLLIFLTFLSANLALVNFLPIPVLDGGHMVFLAAEGIRGKPVEEHVQYYALLIGAAMLLCLMVFVFSNDIINLPIWK